MLATHVQHESCYINAIAMHETAFLPCSVTAECFPAIHTDYCLCSAVCGYLLILQAFLQRYKYICADPIFSIVTEDANRSPNVQRKVAATRDGPEA